MRMKDGIVVRDAIKKFKDTVVLDRVCMSFEAGKVHGLIGRNGSGKTMLMKCICGMVPLTSGEISVDRKVVGRELEVLESVGVIIETPGFLPGYSAYDNLKFLAALNGRIGKKEIREAIKSVGLNPDDRKKVGKYSLGMRQRLGLAQAIMEDPELLILDEPMNGLDKDGVLEMRRYLLDLKNRGKTILIASHNREDIDTLCDTVCEMDKGRLSRVR